MEAAGTMESIGESPRTESVLVVEDEDLVRMLVIETLEESGYRTIEASDAASALTILETDAAIDLMITDVGLPGMNGQQLGEAALECRPGLKILFMTGYAPKSTLSDLSQLRPGMEVLNKPFSVELLASKVRAIMSAAA